MSQRNRATLKSFFQDGALPGAAEFGDLIDSAVNQVDDGFEKTPDEGLRLHSVGNSGALLSLFRGLGASAASWTVSHGAEPGTLVFRPGAGPDEAAIGGGTDGTEPGAPPVAALALAAGRVGINTDSPEWSFDVAGVARMRGRIGAPSTKLRTIPADGGWHDVTHTMTGCHAFEIVAGAGGRVGAGRYALLHATALNAFQPRNIVLNWLFGRRSVRAQHAVYGSFADRIQARWRAAPGQHAYRLQLRSNSSFGRDAAGEPYRIRYYLTRLWFDPRMEGSRGEPPAPEVDL